MDDGDVEGFEMQMSDFCVCLLFARIRASVDSRNGIRTNMLVSMYYATMIRPGRGFLGENGVQCFFQYKMDIANSHYYYYYYYYILFTTLRLSFFWLRTGHTVLASIPRFSVLYCFSTINNIG